jgi:hypothetical protein
VGKMGRCVANGDATREEQSRLMLTRHICPRCEIEPRLIDGFVCGISGCPRKTKKIKKPLTDWLSKNRKKRDEC